MQILKPSDNTLKNERMHFFSCQHRQTTYKRPTQSHSASSVVASGEAVSLIGGHIAKVAVTQVSISPLSKDYAYFICRKRRWVLASHYTQAQTRIN